MTLAVSGASGPELLKREAGVTRRILQPDQLVLVRGERSMGSRKPLPLDTVVPRDHVGKAHPETSYPMSVHDESISSGHGGKAVLTVLSVIHVEPIAAFAHLSPSALDTPQDSGTYMHSPSRQSVPFPSSSPHGLGTTIACDGGSHQSIHPHQLISPIAWSYHQAQTISVQITHPTRWYERQTAGCIFGAEAA